MACPRRLALAQRAEVDPSQERDRRFIDRVSAIDDDKIDAGILTPNHCIAVLRTQPVPNPRIYRNRTPKFCLREPAALACGETEPTAHFDAIV